MKQFFKVFMLAGLSLAATQTQTMTIEEFQAAWSTKWDATEIGDQRASAMSKSYLVDEVELAICVLKAEMGLENYDDLMYARGEALRTKESFNGKYPGILGVLSNADIQRCIDFLYGEFYHNLKSFFASVSDDVYHSYPILAQKELERITFASTIRC